MNFFRRFFVKLSLLFLSLLVCIVVIQVFVSWKVADKRHVEIEQLLYRHLARDMAFEIEPCLREDATTSRIGEVMHFMMVMNPKIEVYLLNEAGEILAYFAEPGLDIKKDRVDTGPIFAFLENEENFPLYGTDPRNPDL